MEIECGPQVNCSELVVRIGDVSEEYIKAELASIGIEEYLIKSKYRSDEKDAEWDTVQNTPKYIKISDMPERFIKAWNNYHDETDKKELTKIKKIITEYGYERYSDTTTFTDGVSLMDDYGASIGVGSYPYQEEGEDNIKSIWYHQHCQPQGFPLLKKIAEHFNSEVEAHDGGSIYTYENWLNGDLDEYEEGR